MTSRCVPPQYGHAARDGQAADGRGVDIAGGAREVMNTHEMAFSLGPMSPTISELTYGKWVIIFTPYRDYWCQLRKIAITELLN